MKLIIFDFDGVVADSERINNEVLAQELTAVGIATTLEDALRDYMGKRWADCETLMEARRGGPLPAGFVEGVIGRADARLLAEVTPVAGLEDFLAEFAHIPRCIASSGTLEYIARVLDCFGLSHWFEHRFSGRDVARGKPFPDLFLKAAKAHGIEPIDCVVIEDSPAGVAAGKAAGMHTIGLCAGSHILDGHSERLREAGADGIASTYRHVAELLVAAR